MDKYEYKVRSDEIKALIAEGEYSQAADIADTIDWRRVKSVMMLCTVSDLYKINRRYEDAKNMLLLAYERRPGGRTICYSLCELCIKTEEFVQALQYYKEFVQAAPKDSSRYILQYKLYEAQEVSLEERIGVLEELKKRDYREKWAYELAFLYHRMGLATRCVEECDEMILWFGDGKYVVKAMELKMLHQPLTPSQQQIYDHRFDGYGQTKEEQPEYAESYEEAPVPAGYEDIGDDGGQIDYEQPKEAGTSDELDIQVKTMDVGQYNTINLQAELAEGLQEVLGEDDIARSVVAPMPEPDAEDNEDDQETAEVFENVQEQAAGELEETEVFFGETGEISQLPSEAVPVLKELDSAEELVQRPQVLKMEPQQEQRVPEGRPQEQENRMTQPPQAEAETAQDTTAEIVIRQMRQEEILTAQPPRELAEVLSQEADGQISLVLPEEAAIEKQLTGQMKIEDVLVEWERMKKANEEKCKEEVRQHVLRQTGPMFTEFEAAVRDGLLEQLENGTASGIDLANELLNSEKTVLAEETLSEQKHIDEETYTEEEAYIPEEEEYLEDTEYAETSEEGYDEPEYGEGEIPAELEYMEEEETYAEEEYEEEAEELAAGEYSDDGEWAEAGGEDELAEEPEYAEEDENGFVEELEYDEAEEDELAAELEDAIENRASGKRKEEPEKKMERRAGKEEKHPVQREKARARGLTREEKELYAPFIQSRHSREQLVKAIDSISMAAYTGNIVVTGEEGMDTLTLAKNMIREVRMTDSNFSGKVAKISGQGLNGRNIVETLERLNNGALIIEDASGINADTAKKLYKSLQQERLGIIVVMEGTKKAVNKLFLENPELAGCFTARMDLEALSNDTLVSFGRLYAREMEYSIDDLGVLALHTRIEELQTIDHAVTVIEVKKIVDEAIQHASRKTLGHFFDILFAKRYDNDDMIILTEKDFVA